MVRVILLGCAVVAVLDGAVWEALGIAAFVVVLMVAAPGGLAPRPWPFRVWFPGGRYDRRG